MGVIPYKEDDNPKFELLKKFRSLRNQHFDLIFKTDSAREFITSDEFLSPKFDTKEMQELKAKVLFEIDEVNRWKRSIISQHDAEEKIYYLSIDTVFLLCFNL